MMPNATARFPRDYSGGQEPTIREDKTLIGDPAVTELWEEYIKPSSITNTWAFRKKVLQVAMRMFGSGKNWFLEQDKNRYIHGYNYDFILDTLRFIDCGRRRLSVHTWPDLLSHQVTEPETVDTRRTLSEYMTEHGIPTTPVEMIQRWCSQPQGIDDMVCTLNLLFGDLTIKGQ